MFSWTIFNMKRWLNPSFFFFCNQHFFFYLFLFFIYFILFIYLFIYLFICLFIYLYCLHFLAFLQSVFLYLKTLDFSKEKCREADNNNFTGNHFEIRHLFFPQNDCYYAHIDQLISNIIFKEWGRVTLNTLWINNWPFTMRLSKHTHIQVVNLHLGSDPIGGGIWI